MALCFIEAELLLIEVLHCGNTHFRRFCSCDLDLDPMTFIIMYEIEPYSLEIYRMCENELLTSCLSKVIVLQPANACI